MEKEKSDMKIVYIMIIIFLLLFFFLYLYLNRKNINLKENTIEEYDTVLIADNMIFQKANNNWNKVTNEANIRKNINWNEYKIYIDYDYFGKYNLVFSDGWLAFDKDRKAINMPVGTMSFFAHTSQDNFDVKKIDVLENTNLERIKKILAEYEININYDPEVNIYTKVDLDNDGVEETIYAICNLIPENATEPAFTLFLVEKNNSLYRLYRATDEVNSANICYPSINAVLDIDNDKEYEIIMSCTNTGFDSIKTVLYKFNHEKDDYEIVISD